MNNTGRFRVLVIGLFLLIAAVVIVQVVNSSGTAYESQQSKIGMGDLRQYEAQASIPVTGAQEGSLPVIGMGDLRLYEAQVSVPVTGMQESSHPYVGMGDLRRFEAEQAVLYP